MMFAPFKSLDRSQAKANVEVEAQEKKKRKFEDAGPSARKSRA